MMFVRLLKTRKSSTDFDGSSYWVANCETQLEIEPRNVASCDRRQVQAEEEQKG